VTANNPVFYLAPRGEFEHAEKQAFKLVEKAENAAPSNEKRLSRFFETAFCFPFL
jgi:hypothetical protein